MFLNNYLLTLYLAPVGWSWIGTGFILFRIFDVWKPQPIRWLDKHVSGGLGIMLDDVMAGLYTNIALHLALRYAGLI